MDLFSFPVVIQSAFSLKLIFHLNAKFPTSFPNCDPN